MVKLGFIGEGAVDKMILESLIFREYLNSIGIDFIKDVVDATGNGNLILRNIEKHAQILKDKGATVILILTDLDEVKCITLTKERVNPSSDYIVVVIIKEVEAWFLADEKAMRIFLKEDTYAIQNPEIIENPFDKIRELRVAKTGRGIGTKIRLAKQMINNSGFSILRAAEHPNCKSAKYFIQKLKSLAS
jgi:Domain of unknown function (DUF4276)